MREEWKSVLMRHGAQYVIGLVHTIGIHQKQMLFVNILDTSKLVRNCLIVSDHLAD